MSEYFKGVIWNNDGVDSWGLTEKGKDLLQRVLEREEKGEEGPPFLSAGECQEFDAIEKTLNEEQLEVLDFWKSKAWKEEKKQLELSEDPEIRDGIQLRFKTKQEIKDIKAKKLMELRAKCKHTNTISNYALDISRKYVAKTIKEETNFCPKCGTQLKEID